MGRCSAVCCRIFLFLLCCVSAPCAMGQGFQNINIDMLRRNVVFIEVPCNQLNPVPSDCTSGSLRPYGTGFLVSVPHKGGGDYVLLATARHMVDPGWVGCPAAPMELHAYFNKAVYDPNKDNEGVVDVIISNSPAMWKYPEDDSADVAVIPLNGRLLDGLGIENQAVSIRDFPSDEELKQVKTGDQVVSAGLLVGVSGKRRNYPVFKFGYVSSIPGEKIGVPCCPTCAAKDLSEWLIAANLVPGNSGSPIYFVPSAFLFSNNPTNRRAILLGSQSISLLGSDVAGMTPVSFLIDAIRRVGLPEADLDVLGKPAPPSPPTQPVPPGSEKKPN